MSLRMMDSELHQRIHARLIADYGFQDKGSWLQQGRCPECAKKELFTHAQHPWILRCGRQNCCGWEQSVKDLYSDLFDNWSNRFPVRKDCPDAAAEAYLRDARGFDLERIRGWYTQGHYRDTVLNASSVTVRFAIGNTFWERLIDKPERFGKKANFKFGGSYAGLWWAPLTLDIQRAKELWLVEGIFDAIALDHHGIAAVAVLSCTNYPEQALAALSKAGHRPRLVWALDSDKAGQQGIIKWVQRACKAGWKCKAAQIPQTKNKLDWNDLHQQDKLNEADIAEYRYHGALLIAESPFERARLLYQKNGLREFVFDYQNRLYCFSLNRAKLQRMRERDAHVDASEHEEVIFQEATQVSIIANCVPRVLYYQADTNTDQSWYVFEIHQSNGSTIQNAFTGPQIATASEFKKRLLSVAPLAFYSGTTRQLNQYLQDQTDLLSWVKTLGFIGYSQQYGCYVFNNIAVKNGRVIEPSKDGCFEFGALRIKSLNREDTLTISRDMQTVHLWLDTLWKCFGGKGLVALAFWLGSLFAEQIRAHTKSFPYLEVIGEPGAGKSTLLEFLWKLLGRGNYEGINPASSSLSALTRNFARVSNLPIVLLEGDHPEQNSHFAVDALKVVYNGRCMRAVSVTNNGTETKEPPFRGALVISQNAPVEASDAIKERLVSLRFDRSQHTDNTRYLAKALEAIPLENVSGFILRAITQEAAVLKTLYERIPIYEAQLHAQSDIHLLARISKNHALMHALVDALSVVVPLSDEQKKAAQTESLRTAENRQHLLNKEDPLVDEFWDFFEFLERNSSETNISYPAESNIPKLNHSCNSKLIAINFNDLTRIARDYGHLVPELSRFSELSKLKERLRTSRRYPFIGIKSVYSAIRSNRNKKEGNTKSSPTTIKCWIFERNTKNDE